MAELGWKSGPAPGDRAEAAAIRPAAEGDVPSIVRIWQQGWEDGHVGHVPEALHRHRGRSDFLARCAARREEFRVASVGGDVAGLVVVTDDEIEQIYVDRLHRGTGVANELLAFGERVIHSAGHRRAWLAVVAGNTRAQAFYRRNGWEDHGLAPYAAAFGDETFEVPVRRFEKDLRVASGEVRS